MDSVSKALLSQQVIDAIYDRVVKGEFDEGQPIRQDALAAEFGISKIPLREALAKLQQEGVLISHANRGFFINPLTEAEAHDVFDLRLRLEPHAIAEAALRADDDDVDEARRALNALDAAIRARNGAAAALNRTFHLALIRPCGRPVTYHTLSRLLLICQRYTYRASQATGAPIRPQWEHESLLEAWASGDGEAALRLAAAHIEAVCDGVFAKVGCEHA